MDSFIYRVVALGLIGTILAIVVGEQKKEFGMLVGICVGIAILFMMADKLTEIRGAIEKLVQLSNIDSEYIGIMLKVIGVAYISEFAVQICNDAGQKSISSKVELAGKVAILAMSSPIFIGLVEMIMSLTI